MLWQGKPIVVLTNDELRDAIISVGEMDNFRFDRLAKKRKRHNKLFDAYAPNQSLAFVNMVMELQTEIKNRKLEL